MPSIPPLPNLQAFEAVARRRSFALAAASNVSVVQWADWFARFSDKRAPDRFRCPWMLHRKDSASRSRARPWQASTSAKENCARFVSAVSTPSSRVRARSDVEDVAQQWEADSPGVAVAGIDCCGALVDANDGSDLSLKVLVFERDLPWFHRRRRGRWR